MSRDCLFKWMIVAVTIGTTVALIAPLGLEFPVNDLWSPLAIAAALAGVAGYYHRRRVESFVATSTALMFVTLYTACYAVMMYACSAIGRPLIDDVLAHFDTLCGVHVPDIMQWAALHPEIKVALQWAYNSLLWQTPLVIIVLGFGGELKALRQFVLQFMLGTWICAVLLIAVPAAGPFAAFGYEMNATQTRYLQHFQELRDGVRTVVTWRGAEGLITFPSFHTTWAILLAWSVRSRKWVFVPSALLNIAVIAATMTTGWHYFADVVGGVAVAVVSICLVHWLTPWLYPQGNMGDTRIRLRLSQLSEESSEPRRQSISAPLPETEELEPVCAVTD